MSADDVDRVVEIERLAALDPVNYEVARAEAAKRLGIRAHVLDRAVDKKRRELGLETDEDDDGQGRAVKIVDVPPWPDPVAGDQIATTLAAAVKIYAVLSDTAADAIALWILHTWLVNRVHHFAAPGRHLADQGLRQDNNFAFAEPASPPAEAGRQYFAAGIVPRRRTISADDPAR